MKFKDMSASERIMIIKIMLILNLMEPGEDEDMDSFLGSIKRKICHVSDAVANLHDMI